MGMDREMTDLPVGQTRFARPKKNGLTSFRVCAKRRIPNDDAGKIENALHRRTRRGPRQPAKI
jgi:hypothetical protein